MPALSLTPQLFFQSIPILTQPLPYSTYRTVLSANSPRGDLKVSHTEYLPFRSGEGHPFWHLKYGVTGTLLFTHSSPYKLPLPGSQHYEGGEWGKGQE